MTVDSPRHFSMLSLASKGQREVGVDRFKEIVLTAAWGWRDGPGSPTGVSVREAKLKEREQAVQEREAVLLVEEARLGALNTEGAGGHSRIQELQVT